MHGRSIGKTFLVIGLLASFYAAPAAAQSAEEFYSGKTVNLIIGFAVGGAYDTVSRLVARHIGKYIPGRPAVVAQNQPGAGSRKAANYLYRQAPRDGTVLGNLHSNLAQVQALGLKGVAYDSRRFNYVGRLSPNTAVLYTWHTSPVKSFADIKTKKAVVAATAPTSDGVIFTLMSNDLLGTKVKAVSGYKGTMAGNLAMERGEADGVINYWEGFKSVLADWIRDKKINLIVQYATERHADISHVPAIYEAAKTGEQREMFKFFVGSGEIGQYFVLPPGVPTERVHAMRDAFDAMVKDPSFVKDAERQKLIVNPLSGAELQQKASAVLNAPPAVIERARRYYPAELLERR